MTVLYDDDAYFETTVEQQRWSVLDESIKMEQRLRQHIDRKRKIRESQRAMSGAASVEREDVYRWARDLVGKELVKRRVEGVWNTIHEERGNAKLEPVLPQPNGIRTARLVDESIKDRLRKSRVLLDGNTQEEAKSATNI